MGKVSGQAGGSLSLDALRFFHRVPKGRVAEKFLIGIGLPIGFFDGVPNRRPKGGRLCDRVVDRAGFLIEFPTGLQIGSSIGFPVTMNCLPEFSMRFWI